MISVVITNHDKYTKRLLERAIPSVLNQSYQDFEIVVVQDGGEDIKNKLPKDDRITYIHRKENFGNHTRPKNEGTLAAKGDLIAYLDSDNSYRVDHLQALYKEYQREPVDVLYGDRMVIDETGKQPNLPGEPRSEFNLSLLSKQNYIDTSDVLCRKEAILSCGGWDESLAYFADYNLWVRMAKAGKKFRRVPLIITDYYSHGKNNVLKSWKKVEEMKKRGVDPATPQAQTELKGFDIQGCKIWPDKTTVGKRPKLKVAVYTLTMNRLKHTMETLESMHKTTKYPFDHYVLDQGSEDKTWTWLCDNSKKYNLKLHTEEKNLGISRGSNYLLDKIGYEYDVIIKVDNDLEFITGGWLETIVDIYERTRGVVVSPYIEGLIDHPGGFPRIRDGYLDKNYVGIVQHLGGACIAAPTDVYKGFRWEENDFYHGEQDWIFSQAVLKSGRVLMYLENVKVEHKFDTSSGANPQDKNEKEYLRARKEHRVKKYE